MLASWGANLAPNAGSARAISSAADAIAIVPGWRITKWEKRYQRPFVSGRSVFFADRCSQEGENAFTRSPSSESSAGSTISAVTAQRSAIAMPLIATE
jgi:hypothetical protein